MNPIRPNGLAPTPQATPTPRTDAGRMAAQRAFFDMIAGKAPTAAAAPSASASASATTPASPAPAPRAAAAAESPAKILRPGSLLDIRV